MSMEALTLTRSPSPAEKAAVLLHSLMSTHLASECDLVVCLSPLLHSLQSLQLLAIASQAEMPSKIVRQWIRRLHSLLLLKVGRSIDRSSQCLASSTTLSLSLPFFLMQSELRWAALVLLCETIRAVSASLLLENYASWLDILANLLKVVRSWTLIMTPVKTISSSYYSLLFVFSSLYDTSTTTRCLSSLELPVLLLVFSSNVLSRWTTMSRELSQPVIYRRSFHRCSHSSILNEEPS